MAAINRLTGATALEGYEPKRDENGRVVKGHTPNPFGRAGRRNVLIEHWIRAEVEDPLEGHKVIRRLLEILASKDRMAAVQAAKILMEYGYGKPKQRMEICGPDGSEVKQVIIIGNQRIEF